MLTSSRCADRILLYNLSWQQYENLLSDLGEGCKARMAFDRGTLEIMTPLLEHEYYKEIIGDLVKEIADELEVDYESFGSTTWKREIKLAGVEPDNCFYFQNEARIRGKLEYDLEQDPPPDLALEIDITSKSLPRFPIYARLGVPEIWVYDAGALSIYQLLGEEYHEVDRSQIFPQLRIQELPQLMAEEMQNGRRALRSRVRDWVREQVR